VIPLLLVGAEDSDNQEGSAEVVMVADVMQGGDGVAIVAEWLLLLLLLVPRLMDMILLMRSFRA
jgi:hypothetical protein